MSIAEKELEDHLIAKLEGLKYVYRRDIRDKAALDANFREKFETLNRVTLTDGESKRLYDEIVTADVFANSQVLRGRNSFVRDDGTPLNYTLVNIKDWCKNRFEVVNQLRINTDSSHHRYDVMLLINGIPVVQIELKTLGITPRRAMQQIVDYKSDPGNGYTRTLLCFVQLFVVSNRTETYYFTNNNARHFSFNADEQFLPVYQFADPDNSKVSHLDDFADRFLAKCTLGRMISRYTVLVVSEQKLMMMRPYQIYAVQQIVDCIEENSGNGYIWHTTGSGKTLTSFKASTLLKANETIHKCLFVVDRKDLDRQTREEFNRFQENCVEENTNTGTLVRRMLSDDYADKVIVTTIQKLGLALDEQSRRNRKRSDKGLDTYASQLEPLQDKRIVFIFDECHRSQFGETHQTIKEFFPNSQLFGFTGTPIFEQNSTVQKVEGVRASMMTTADLFQQSLHEYTITHAIDDRNVLRFHVDYYGMEPDTASSDSGRSVVKDASVGFRVDKKTKAKTKAFTAPDKRTVVEAIIDKHDAATAGRRFNALFATSSINDAIEYHDLFAEIQGANAEADPDYRPLKIAAVFSPPAEGNKDVQQLQEDLPQEQADNASEPEKKKEALKQIIADYNAAYGTNHAIGEFDAYYQDVQQRIKSQQYDDADLPRGGAEKIDITIVVDMLLTGFDSKYLNTLYVDKPLRHHGLIQAFSRTNRVLNDTKPYGHILDFRGQQDNVDAAIALFSGAKTDSPASIWLVDKAPVVIEKLKEAKQSLDAFMQSQNVEAKPSEVTNLRGNEARAGFVQRFKEVQRLQTQLDQYTDLTDEQKRAIEDVIPKDESREFRGAYLETVKRLRAARGQTGGPPPPAVDNLDFELVLFASATIDYDYIMGLIARQTNQTPKQQEVSRDQLIGLIASDAKFIDERDEIVEFVRSLPTDKAMSEVEVKRDYAAFKAKRQSAEVDRLAQTHGLPPESLHDFVDTILTRMVFDGERLTDLMAPLDLGWRDRREKELALMDDLLPLLKKRAGGRKVSGLAAYES